MASYSRNSPHSAKHEWLHSSRLWRQEIYRVDTNISALRNLKLDEVIASEIFSIVHESRFFGLKVQFVKHPYIQTHTDSTMFL